MYLGEICWQEAESVLKNPDTIVVIPVGSTEQHGCVGPLGTDWLIPDEFCRRLNAEKSNLLIVPTIAYGVATHHINFPGTIDLGLDVMIGVMKSVFESLFRHGARRFVVINGHGGNDPAIEKAALDIYRKGGLVSLIDWWGIAPKLNEAWPTGHGDAQEVSAVMAFRPDLIKPEYLRDNVVPTPAPGFTPVHINTVLFEGAPVKIIREIRDTATTGGFGGLTADKATKEWGDAMMAGMTAWMSRFIDEFRQVELPKTNWS